MSPCGRREQFSAAAGKVKHALTDLDVVVVVHRCAPVLIERSFAALVAALGDEWRGRLVIVENRAGPATSAAARTAGARLNPTIVRCRRNLGFGAAVNLGVDRTTSDFVATFNPDGAVAADAPRLLVEALAADHDAFMAGARVVSFSDEADDAPWQEPPGAVAVDFLPGTAIVFRRQRFIELGGFDPLYFMYLEDTDLSRRAAARWRLLHVPAAVFRHGGRQTARERGRRARMWTESAATFSYRWAPSRRQVVRQILVRRTRALRTLARQRQWWRVAGGTAGLLLWPRHLPRAEYRRRHPWDQASLERWLARTQKHVLAAGR